MFTEARFKLAKTEAGRDALAQRTGCSPRERQVLILCDGRKTWGDLVALLGQPVLPVLASLQQKGFVLSVTPMLERLAEFSDTGTYVAVGEAGAEPGSADAGPPRDRIADVSKSARADQAGAKLHESKAPAQQRSGGGQADHGAHHRAARPDQRAQAAHMPSAQAQTQSQTARAPARSQRSLAASKMYLVDVFRKQRSAAAHAHLMQLQAAGDADALVQAMLPAMAFLLSESGASYASRVLTHVMASLPEAQLGEFCDGALALGLAQQMELA